jgi:hypothetical protein
MMSGFSPVAVRRRCRSSVPPVLAWRAARRFWLAISVVAFVIWLLGGASGGPWFLWVAVPLGLRSGRRAGQHEGAPGFGRAWLGRPWQTTGDDTGLPWPWRLSQVPPDPWGIGPVQLAPVSRTAVLNGTRVLAAAVGAQPP